MTTEEDFQRALDACPDDWQTRLVFADWLEEHGDSRAEAYRALGGLRYAPQPSASNVRDWCIFPTGLPADWYAMCGWYRFPGGRLAAENTLVRAFARLSAERRAELSKVS